VNDIEVAKQAVEHGMTAIVIKSHLESTVGRSIIASQSVKGTKVFGAIVLNYQFGFNPFAVKSAISLGAKVIWMPTIHSRNEMRNIDRSSMVGAHIPTDKPGLSVLDDRGNVLREVEDILHLIAKSDSVLATGHLAVSEQKKLIQKARDAGVKRIIVTHPMIVNPFSHEFSAYTLEDYREVAGMGVLFEHLYGTMIPRNIPVKAAAEIIKEIGAKHFILGTDGGAASGRLTPVEMLARFVQGMIDCGISERDIRTMITDNPASLLGLK
jgi:hypothetical protein